MSKVNARDRLILALDVPSLDEGERFLDCVGDAVTFVKIGGSSTGWPATNS